MYKEYFGLKDNPFDLTPDSHFLFPSKKHQEALAHLTYGIEARKGFILITGEVGAGKTTLCRALLSRVNENVEVAFVLNSYLNAFEILQTINQDLGIHTKAQSKKELIDELNEFLLRQKQQNKNVVVLIDECQNLPFETLEQLRMLSNLETEKEKLLQIIMVGQPELLDILGSPELRQLNQRITVRYHLYPLDFNETVEYIYHRLRIAGAQEDAVEFSESSLKMIYKFSHGVPRIINVVCDNALLAAYVAETKKVSPGLVKKAIREIKGKKPLKDIENQFMSTNFSLKRVIRYSFVGLVFLFIFFAFYNYKELKYSIGTYSETMEDSRRLYQTALDRLREEAIRMKALTELSREQAVVDVQQGQPVRIVQQPAPPRPVNPSMKPLTTLLSLWDVDEELISSINERYQHELKLDYEEFALSAGLSAVVSWAELETLDKFGLPVLLEVTDKKYIRKYVLLQKIEEGTAHIVDESGEKAFSLSFLKRVFIGKAIVFVNDIVNDDEIFYKTTTGRIVSEIQKQLRDIGYYSGDINGEYTDEVVTAVKEFQKKKGLNPDGIVDVNTRLALIGAQKNENKQGL
ncbi:MAG: AAA family ATPase [Candidatus Auribacterota bacterium]|jgi:general secretion pathway protein A|uniref:DUF2075 domain-containing protein n=1 Tax=Candidatus Auribacter fodinae TaxID=2093366 RepID=A0A3A4R199_9BACT|nr:MAG: DUF2075 domain-containing protein [Candidatus Auribacter fodinae]